MSDFDSGPPYVFPDGYKRAISVGPDGTISRKDARKNIHQKTRNIDSRLQQFINDVHFLFDNVGEDEVLDSSVISEAFTQVDPDVDRRDWTMGSIKPLGGRFDNSLDNMDTRIGFALSELVRPFVETLDNLDRTAVSVAFNNGMTLESDEEYEKEEERIDDIISELETSKFHRKFDILKVDRPGSYSKNEYEAVKNLGFAPTRPLSGIWRWIENLNLTAEFSEYTQSSNEFEKTVESYEQIYEKIFTNLLSNNDKFRRVHVLRKDLDEDQLKLSEKAWNGIVPLSVIKVIGESGGQVDPRDLPEKVGKVDDRPDWGKELTSSEVAKICNNLAGLNSGFPSYPTEIHILDRDSKNSNKISLTAYGELFYQVYFEVENGHGELHKYALSDRKTELSGLISEVIDAHFSIPTKRKSITSNEEYFMDTTSNLG